MKNPLLYILFFSTFPYAMGQDCSSILSGKVLDYHNKAVLANASILIISEKMRTHSDKNGNYSLSGLCDGKYEMEVEHPSCATQIIPITINGNTSLEIKLEHHLEELGEVNVIGEAIYGKTNSAQEVTLKTRALEQFSTTNLAEAIKELDGVSALSTGATISKPIIHGLTGSRVLIVNDGVRMQDMEWGDEHAPNVDINSAASITVIKGASALQYGGDALGGVIVLEPQKVFPKDTLFGRTLLNMVSNGRGGNISSDLTKVFKNGFYVKGQISNKLLGDQESPGYILSNTGIGEKGANFQFGKRRLEWGFNAKYSYYNADISILRASHIGNVDDLIRAINSGQPETIEPFTYKIKNPKQKVRHHLAKVHFYKRFEGLGKWSVQYDFQSNRRFEFDVRRGERSNKAAMDLELTTHTLSSDFKWDAKDKVQLRFGAMGRYQDNFANPITGVRRLIPDYERFDFGSFLIGEYRLDDEWVIDAGIRYDFTQIDAKKFYRSSRWLERGYDNGFEDNIIGSVMNGEVQMGLIDYGLPQLLANPVFDFHNISATAGMQYKRKGNTFRCNYSLSQRAPNPSELFSDGLHHSAARIELGDLRMDNEIAHKFSISNVFNYKNWGITVAPYINFITDFILLEPTEVEDTIRGAFPIWSYRQANVRLIGFDISGYVDWSAHWGTEHRFSLVKGNDLDNDAPLINVPSANFRNKLSYKKPEWKGLELSLQSNYVFRQNETPPNFTVFSRTEQGQGERVLKINTPPNAYQLLDFHSKITFAIGAKALMSTSLTINNLLDTAYREYLNRQRFFANDLGRNVILQLKLNY